MKNKIVLAAILLGCVLLFSVYGQQGLCGDVDSNGSIGITDALLIAKCYIGIITCPAAVSDVNCSGITDIVDALRVAQYYVGIISSLSCCTSTPSTVLVGVSAGMQCETLRYPSLEYAVSLLETNGIHVLASFTLYQVVCAACSICPDSRIWVAQINNTDKDKAVSLGWGVMPNP